MTSGIPGHSTVPSVRRGGMLSRRIFKEYGIDLKELETLRDIYLVRIGKEEAVSRISGGQQELLDRIGVKLDI